MKKTYLIASFLAVAAGSIGASAVLNLNGSDTLFTISTDVIKSSTAFPGAPGDLVPAITTLSYIGGGSGTAESGMASGAQQVGPMSRFLKSGAPCTGTSASPTTSEGLVIALDGVSVIMNTVVGTQATCNGASQTDTSKQTGLGMAANTTVTWAGGNYTTYGNTTASYAGGSYTFSDWTDVLRILFAGMDHNAGSAQANQNCSSDVRVALIKNWGAIFQAPAGCTSGTCTSLTHAFRRDDFSGTTDTFVSVLGLNGIPGNHVTDPFCNAPTPNAHFTFPPAGLPKPMQFNAVVPGVLPLATFLDLDPVRVTCASSDMVCDQDGTLGWEIVVEPTSDITALQAYPTAVGTTKMGFGVTGILSDGAHNYCPNGDTPVFVNECLMPLDTSGNFSNQAATGSVPLFSFGGGNFSTAIDGRVYNLLTHKGGTGSDSGSLLAASNGIGFQASYFRNFGASCQLLDATQEIGCIIGTASAQPCAIGYAGLGATAQAGADAMRLDGVLPVTSNVQTFGYPLSRKLYLDTLKGFENVTNTNGELTFAKAEAQTDEIDYYVSNEGFVVLPASVTLGGSAGAPYCEDFNEVMICGAAGPNTNACANNNTNGVTGIPTGGTICGNGTQESYERCDSGTLNGTAGSNCSTTCTCKKGSVTATGLCCINAAGLDCCNPANGCSPGVGI